MANLPEWVTDAMDATAGAAFRVASPVNELINGSPNTVWINGRELPLTDSRAPQLAADRCRSLLATYAAVNTQLRALQADPVWMAQAGGKQAHADTRTDWLNARQAVIMFLENTGTILRLQGVRPRAVGIGELDWADFTAEQSDKQRSGFIYLTGSRRVDFGDGAALEAFAQRERERLLSTFGLSTSSPSGKSQTMGEPITISTAAAACIIIGCVALVSVAFMVYLDRQKQMQLAEKTQTQIDARLAQRDRLIADYKRTGDTNLLALAADEAKLATTLAETSPGLQPGMLEGLTGGLKTVAIVAAGGLAVYLLFPVLMAKRASKVVSRE